MRNGLGVVEEEAMCNELGVVEDESVHNRLGATNTGHRPRG